MDWHNSTLSLLLSLPLDVLEWLIKLPLGLFRAYGDLVRWAATSVKSLFDTYGYWVIFFGTLCENTLLLGLVVPGALVIILAGLTAANGGLSWPLAILVGIAGTVLGDTISYFLGRYGWSRFGNTPAIRDALDKVREPIMRRGIFFVLVYHFAGYTRLVGPAAAGVLKLPFARWAPFDYTGASLWVASYVGIGYGLGLAGLTLEASNRWFQVFEWGLLVLVVIWGFYLFRMAQPLMHDSDFDDAPEDIEV